MVLSSINSSRVPNPQATSCHHQCSPSCTNMATTICQACAECTAAYGKVYCTCPCTMQARTCCSLNCSNTSLLLKRRQRSRPAAGRYVNKEFTYAMYVAAQCRLFSRVSSVCCADNGSFCTKHLSPNTRLGTQKIQTLNRFKTGAAAYINSISMRVSHMACCTRQCWT